MGPDHDAHADGRKFPAGRRQSDSGISQCSLNRPAPRKIETEDYVNRIISIPKTYAIIACAIVACTFAPVRAADMAAAKSNYDTFCVKCHGPGGKGDGPAAA